MTVFLTTHYLEEADNLAERLAIIDHGRIVSEGTPASLKASIGGDVVSVGVAAGRTEVAAEALSRLEGLTELRPEQSGLTLFVRDGNETVANVVRLLDAAGVPVGSVALSQPSLDEVFLRVTGSRLGELRRWKMTDFALTMQKNYRLAVRA